ncbi:MAG: hypothetical protein Q7R75_01250 [bacterium]|nr:hypothetical protein [bacterium]
MIHVYRTDYDGRFANSLGFFRDPNVAMAFAGMQDGGTSYTKTASTLILTDGTVGYQLTQQESVKFFDDEKEALDLRQKALAKLSPAERALLGFMD